MVNLEDIRVYAVMNKEGKWFRRTGYGGLGESWTNDFGHASVFTKITTPRSVISNFFRKWPEYGIPKLVLITAASLQEIEEEERVIKSTKKKIEKDLESCKKYSNGNEYILNRIKKLEKGLEYINAKENNERVDKQSPRLAINE